MNRKHILICSVLASSLLGATLPVGHAQTNRGEKSEQEACEPDVMKLCRAVSKSGDLVVLKCLQQNRKRLGKTCRRVLDSHGV